MIVIDTNVLSEPLRPEPNANVLKWLDDQALESLFITATVLSEMLFGVERLPDGKRKERIRADTDTLIQSYFGARILPFDDNAARIFAVNIAHALANGKAVQVSDGQIAAVALSQGFAVATRDIAPFEAMGVKTINPWQL